MSSGYFDKLWLQHSVNETAIRRAIETIALRGKSLPCRIIEVVGQIVTVEFDVDSAPWTLPPVTIPVASSPYDYVPYQLGDTGLTMPADVYLGGISGLGGGTADMSRRANLTALVFVPVGKQSFTPTNVNARIIQGPDGWIAQTTQGNTPCNIVGNQQGITLTYGSTQIAMNATSITMTAGGQTVTLNSSGFDIGGILFGTHTHSYLPGTGTQTDTGVPV